MSAQPEQYISLEEYFKFEETSDIKHEYYQGTIFAMAGASENHNLIFTAVFLIWVSSLTKNPADRTPVISA